MKKTPLKKKKTTSIAKLKDKCWSLYSEWRRRSLADKNGYLVCVTCGKKAHWKEMQGGHFIQGRYNSILFIDDNVHPQCVGCNIFKHGALIEYYDYMIKTYGQKRIDELKQLKNKIVKFTVEYLQDFMEELKNRIEKL